MSERRTQRTLREKIMCFIGLHDWGDPHVMETKLTIHGTKSGDGYDISVDESPDRNARVVQVCQRPACHGSRDRPDLAVYDNRHRGAAGDRPEADTDA